MEKVWVKSYTEGVPAEINPDIYHSLNDLFQQNCAKFAHKVAVSNMGCELTYAELARLSENFAAYLQKRLNLGKGDRIALMMPNLLQYYVAMFGALQAGCMIVNVNPLYTARELGHQLADSGATVVVALANFVSTLEQALPETQVKHVIVTEIGDLFRFFKRVVVNFVVRHVKKMVPAHSLTNAITFSQLLHEGAHLKYEHVQVGAEDVAYLQYTGGTTGVAKGAILTHRNMLANIEQIYRWVGKNLNEGEEIIITPLPLYHIFSLTVCSWGFLRAGGHSVLITNPRDISSFVKQLSKIPFSVFVGLNTLFNALINHPDFHKIDFSSVKLTIAGGMALQQVVAEKWRNITGNWITEGYGLTEASPVITINPIGVKEYHRGIGLPVPSTDISIRAEDGTEVALGETGELYTRGPQVMRGYWQRDDETKKVLSEDGWLRTGDMVYMDQDGRIYIVDRKKDMVIVSGFNVYPNEIEEVLAQHPGILEVAVIGVKDEHSGEAVKAFIVKKDPNLTEEEIKNYARKNLTAYKVPKYIEFRNELPKSNVGKVLRRALREGGSHA